MGYREPRPSGFHTIANAGRNRTQATELNGRTLNWNYDNIYRLTNYRLTNEAVSADPAPASKNGNVAHTIGPVGNRQKIISSLSGVNSGGTFTFNPDYQLAGCPSHWLTPDAWAHP